MNITDPSVSIIGKRHARLAWFVFLLLLAYYLCLNAEPLFHHAYVETGDFAANALKIENASQGREIYGNYSRWHFNHPGPFYWYAYASGELLFYKLLHIVPAPGNAHILTFLILSLGFLVGGIHCLTKAFNSPSLLLILSALAMLILVPQADYFIIHWPPYQVIMPLFLAACAAVALSLGNSWALPALIIGSGVSLHAHVAQPLFIGVIGIFVIVMLAASKARREALLPIPRKTLLTCLVLAGVLSIPFVYDGALWILSRESNVGQILKHMHGHHGSRHTWASALEHLLQFLGTDTTFHHQTPDGHIARCLSSNVVAFVFASLVLLYNLVLLLSVIIRRQFAVRTMGGISLLGLGLMAATLSWATMQDGEQFLFNSLFVYSIFLLNCVPVVLSLTRTLEQRCRWSVPVLFVFLVGSAAYGDRNARSHYLRTSPEESLVTSPRFAKWMEVASQKPVLLQFNKNDWLLGTTLACQLKRLRIPFAVDHQWEFMFGRENGSQHLLETSILEGRGLQVWKVVEQNESSASPGAWNTIGSYTLHIPAPLIVNDSIITYDAAEIQRRSILYGFRTNAAGTLLVGKGTESKMFIPVHPSSLPFMIRFWFALPSHAYHPFKLSVGIKSREQIQSDGKTESLDINLGQSAQTECIRDGGVLLHFLWAGLGARIIKIEAVPIAMKAEPPKPQSIDLPRSE